MSSVQSQRPDNEAFPLTLLMAQDGFKNDIDNPIGRRSAGASFLDAYLRYGGNQTHHLVVPDPNDADWFQTVALAFNPQATSQTIHIRNWGRAAKATGTFHFPDPHLERWAWRRMVYGDGEISLLGVMHTLSGNAIQNALSEFSSAPIRSWDALICTSRAGRKVVEGFLERQENYLRWRHGAMRFERPQLPLIPLGIDPTAWTPGENSQQARSKARADLNLPADADLVLIAGRLDFLTKFQPAPLLRVLEELRRSEQPKLELVIYGEAKNDTQMEKWKTGAAQLAPSVPIHWIPGRKPELAGPVRWACDLFISLADNPQETFGITPLEAMAAGLPCIVSDWDGYRDTVVQPGEAEEATGLRIPTRLQQGLGNPESIACINGAMGDRPAIGLLSQGIAVDLAVLRQSINQLLSNPEQRQAMGEAGQRRVARLYDWKVVIEQWRDLIQDLNQRRELAREAGTTLRPQLPPTRPNISTAFGCYATEVLGPEWDPPAPDRVLEKEYLNNPFQDWDSTLLSSQGPRRRGWWLKHGLVKP